MSASKKHKVKFELQVICGWEEEGRAIVFFFPKYLLARLEKCVVVLKNSYQFLNRNIRNL